ncbi:MAG: hypothetical protein NVSMB27_34050 [Ktedonobacteraceae bacterium]
MDAPKQHVQIVTDLPQGFPAGRPIQTSSLMPSHLGDPLPKLAHRHDLFSDVGFGYHDLDRRQFHRPTHGLVWRAAGLIA